MIEFTTCHCYSSSNTNYVLSVSVGWHVCSTSHRCGIFWSRVGERYSGTWYHHCWICWWKICRYVNNTSCIYTCCLSVLIENGVVKVRFYSTTCTSLIQLSQHNIIVRNYLVWLSLKSKVGIHCICQMSYNHTSFSVGTILDLLVILWIMGWKCV